MKKLLLFLSALGILQTSCIERVGKMKPNIPEEPESAALKAFRIEKSLNPMLDKDIEFRIYDNHNITAYATSEVNLESLRPSFDVQHGTLSVSGTSQQSGVTRNNFSDKITYVLTGEDGKTTNYTVHLIPYTGLPVVTITTNGAKEILNKEDWLPGLMTIDGMGRFDDFSDSLYVRGRGNGSWKFPKKPFNAKLYAKSEVLGMKKHKRWCFLANYRDRTLLRNDLTLKIGQQAEGLEWTPDGEFAEVIVNGEHRGNFYICEHIRVDKNRVNIDEMELADTEGEKLTGGYLLELDTYYDEVNKFRSALNNWPVNLRSPDEDVCGREQFAYIRDYFNKVEGLLSEGKFAEAYESYIDKNSFADYFLVQTLAGNTEIKSIYSIFCYKKRNGKLYAGPLWDFDLSAFAKESGTSTDGAVWYKYLLKDPAFVSLLRERYAVLKPKIDAWAPDYIRSRATYLKASVDENWKQWEIDTKYLYNKLNGDETMASYDEAVDRMVRIYEARSSWLETFLAGLK